MCSTNGAVCRMQILSRKQIYKDIISRHALWTVHCVWFFRVSSVAKCPWVHYGNTRQVQNERLESKASSDQLAKAGGPVTVGVTVYTVDSLSHPAELSMVSADSSSSDSGSRGCELVNRTPTHKCWPIWTMCVN